MRENGREITPEEVEEFDRKIVAMVEERQERKRNGEDQNVEEPTSSEPTQYPVPSPSKWEKRQPALDIVFHV